MPLSHSRALLLMVLVTAMWSMAGVVTRQLESARSFEVTFWRSLFNAMALLLALAWLRRRQGLWRSLRQGGPYLWWSGLCWTVMFTNFMVAITLTTVATVLITMSIAPLLTALFARLFLQHRLPLRTWLAIGVAGLGIAWMFGQQALAGGGSMTGALVALGVPIAGAANWTLLQYLNQRDGKLQAAATASTVGGQPPAANVPKGGAHQPDMLLAVLLGAVLSAAITLPLAWPLSASAHDLQLLGLLGVFQLAIPCLLVVQLAKVLPAPEISLIGLLEVVFGVLLAWWGAGEVPGPTALQGGALVVGALLVNEWLALRSRQASATVGAGRLLTPTEPT